MKRWGILATALTFALTGCGVMDDMKHLTQDTKDEVHRTNETSEAIKEGQALAAAIAFMVDPHISPSQRTAAAEVVFIKAPEDRIGKYMGMPGLINMITVPKPNGTKTVTLPNVTIVSTDANPEPNHVLGISPMNLDLYKIVAFSVSNVLEQLNYQVSANPPNDTATLNDLRSKTTRMMYVATAVLGAIDIENLKDYYMNGRGARKFVADTLNPTARARAAELLTSLGNNLVLPETTKRTMRAQLDIKLAP